MKDMDGGLAGEIFGAGALGAFVGGGDIWDAVLVVVGEEYADVGAASLSFGDEPNRRIRIFPA